MTSVRPYRKSVMSSKDAIGELERQAGTQFDARVVRVFVMLLTGRLDPDDDEAGARNL
ncbi:hypothetical protein D3C87_2093780 [compost metagenome]